MYGALFRICVATTVICVANANLSEVSKKVNAAHFRKLLEDFRQRLCYDDPNGLPQLEPLVFNEHIPLKLDNEVGNIEGYFRNVHITGISNYKVQDVAFHIAGFEFDVTILIPKMFVSGEYGAKGKFAMLLSVHGEDVFTCELGGVRVRITGAFVSDNNIWSLKVKDLETSVETTHSNFQGLANDKEANEFLNKVISELTPQFFKQYLPLAVTNSIKDSVERVGSTIFKSESALDLIDIITGETSLFTPLRDEQACKIV